MNLIESVEEINGMYPCTVVRSGKITDKTLLNTKDSTIYGYAYKDSMIGDRPIKADQYFSLPTKNNLIVSGDVFLVIRKGFFGQSLVGDIQHGHGRLSYIDGCSDSILVYPPRMGDPNLNYLYFPENTKQTTHNHPSVRIGTVIKGSGIAYSKKSGINYLNEGDVFIIHEKILHHFETRLDSMEIVVYHPDTDFGPTDDVHPMINRTLRG